MSQQQTQETQDQMQPAGERQDHTGRSFWQSGVVRLALVVTAVVVVAVVVGALALYSYRSSRDKPLNVAVYPGAQLVASEVRYDGFDHQQYVTTDPFEKIEQFYVAQDDMDCEPQYATVEDRPGQEPLKEGHVFTRCQIDHSGWGITQFTTVLIQPVIDENQTPTGEVLIDVQRTWGG